MGLIDRILGTDIDSLPNNYTPKIPTSISDVDFHNIISKIEDEFKPEPHRDEKEFQNQLIQFLRALGHDVEKEHQIDNESRIDILVDNRFAFEIKRAKSKTVLRNLSAQLDDYSESFPKICAILIVENESMLDMVEDFKIKYKEKHNAETIILQNKKTNRRKSHGSISQSGQASGRKSSDYVVVNGKAYKKAKVRKRKRRQEVDYESDSGNSLGDMVNTIADNLAVDTETFFDSSSDPPKKRRKKSSDSYADSLGDLNDNFGL